MKSLLKIVVEAFAGIKLNVFARFNADRLARRRIMFLTLCTFAHFQFTDAGYNFYEWEDYLREIDNMKLQVPRKINSKRAREPWLEIHKSLMRKYIETTIGEISKLFPKKIYATNLDVFLLKPALFLFAHQIDKAFIQ